MKKTLTLTCVFLVWSSSNLAAVPDKITGPWLWMCAPTPGKCGKDGTKTDWLKEASNGKVTEAQIAKAGAKAGNVVGKLKWTKGKLNAQGGNNINDVIVAIDLGDGDINNHVAYSYIVIESEKEQGPVAMHAGSDDAIKVWLNGKVVHENPVNRGAGNFQEWFKVNLKKGENKLLCAVYECGGGWSGFFGIAADFKAGGKVYKAEDAGLPPDPGKKIEGPWLWMMTPSQPCGKDGNEMDWLDKTSKGKVTEAKVASRGPRKGDKVGKLKWTEGEITDAGGNNINDTINKIKLGKGDINNHFSYAYINVVSPKSADGFMFVGSDDSIMVWLNGEEVHKNNINRGAGNFQEHFKVSLKKGDNPLLVKVGECGGGWSMFVGFDGNIQKGLKFNTKRANLAVSLGDKFPTAWGEIKAR